ncbi:DNA repair protein XRCC1 [Trichoplax sp. H2]|nr:DNA repair protein XRCC1 [Trichoplax sp. H2]|eukprot:RDD36363.1 DNA repair protein XRCC1 [Trichoplax sp. H2]
MPEIAFSHIVSCSSEDKVYCAKNLLNADTFRKWKSADPGDKQVAVIIQFNKAEKIDAIHIGNEGSAFIEVLVGKSAWTHNEDFKVILVTSSFMSPQESKNGINLNRVRMFDSNKLSKSVLDESWDRIKVICTQPYNKNVTYGLSFIKLISPGGNDATGGDKTPPSVSRLGGFHMKKENDQKFVPGALFRTFSKDVSQVEKRTQDLQPSTWKKKVIEVKMENEKVDNSQLPVDTSLSHRSKIASISKASVTIPAKRKSDDLAKATTKQKVDIKGNNVASPQVKKPRVEAITGAKAAVTPVQKVTDDNAGITKKISLKIAEEISTDDDASDEEPLRKVIAVLSGYQNPLRGQLRTKLTNLGGQYRPDWGKDCTHLICAFKSTPKYRQVRKTKGRIVSSDWLTDCYKHKKRLLTKKYSLRSDDETSSDEDYNWKKRKASSMKRTQSKQDSMSTSGKKNAEAESKTKITSQQSADAAEISSIQNNKASTSSKPHVAKLPERTGSQMTDDTPATLPLEVLDDIPATLPLALQQDISATLPLDNSNDTDSTLPLDDVNDSDATLPLDADSGSESSSKENKSDRIEDKNYDPYECSTEDEEEVQENPNSDISLPDYFSGMRFLIYGDFSYDERRILIRYLTAYDGHVEEYMGEKVNIVVTDNEWDEKFDQAVADFPNLTFLRSEWIYECHNQRKRLPFQKYLITP